MRRRARQNYNNELVTCIEDCSKREEVNVDRADEEEKAKIQNDLRILTAGCRG